MNYQGKLQAGGLLATILFSNVAFAQAPAANGTADVAPPAADAGGADSGVADIIVTAQKREQRLNDVGMSISAIGANDLQARGIDGVGQLAKIVPGFVFTPSSYSNPVYTIRGVGFYEASLAASPAVTVYTDEVPLPYPAMTSYADFDLERVEVLKGPQGTVFGQNSTGGAVNYIAAKPTDHFTAGVDASFERFDTAKFGGFVGGPLSDTLTARFAVRSTIGGDWQKSYTRDDSLGEQFRVQARALFDFKPSERLSFLLNLNGWFDKSDPQALQSIALMPTNPGAVKPHLQNYPIAPANARAADWNPGFPRRNNNFYQAALRGVYELTDDIAITSITAYSRFKVSENNDEGFDVHASDQILGGHITSFSQELRLGGKSGPLTWLLGGNYSKDRSTDTQVGIAPFSSNSPFAPGFPPFDHSTTFVKSRIRTIAGFANLEYEIADGLTLQAGARYTDNRRSIVGCSQADQGLATSFEILQFAIKGSFVPIPVGGCFTLDQTFTPTLVTDTLHQHNVSWRGGINWKVTPETLLYANVSRGYKAGSFGTLAFAFASQLLPVTQEAVTAYEAGFKTSMFDRKLQVTGAGFYYDYKDKQLRAKINDPIFGNIDALVNIPKSRLWGAELQLTAVPTQGLTLNLGATYLNSKIQGHFVTFPQIGNQVDVGGNRYPFTPEVIVVGDGQYRWSIGPSHSAFVGAGFTYNSRTTSDIGDADLLRIKPYTVIDASAGIIGPDDKWRLTVFGKNITNVYYWVNAVHYFENVTRITAKPVTYGVSFSYRY